MSLARLDASLSIINEAGIENVNNRTQEFIKYMKEKMKVFKEDVVVLNQESLYSGHISIRSVRKDLTTQ